MKPCSMPKASSSTFAMGATQFVVHDALETIECFSASYWSSLTPSTSVMSGSVAGAEMTTFCAPASRCFCAPSRSVKNPVDSRTTSTSRSRHGRLAGSRSASPVSSLPATFNEPPETSTSCGNVPSTESCLRRCAIVPASPRSLYATTSKSASRSSAARKKLRPIRPNPLIPTRVFAMRRLYLRGACGDSVEIRELLAEVPHVRLGIDLAPADGPLERLGGCELAAVPVQVVAQPVAKRREVALLEGVGEIRQVGADALPELGRDEVAERVRREVTEVSARPMRVLEHSVSVVRNLDPQVIPHTAVPLLGKLLEGERAGQELLLELEAEDDVQVVRRLVRLDADQGRPDGVDLAIPPFDVVAREHLRVRLLKPREEVAPERERAPDQVLPHPALRLVDAERDTAGERRALQGAMDLVVGEAVAELVQRREERGEVGREVARGHAEGVDAGAGRERVHGGIEPPRLFVEPEAAHDFELEPLLQLERELPA